MESVGRESGVFTTHDDPLRGLMILFASRTLMQCRMVGVKTEFISSLFFNSSTNSTEEILSIPGVLLYE